MGLARVAGVTVPAGDVSSPVAASHGAFVPRPGPRGSTGPGPASSGGWAVAARKSQLQRPAIAMAARAARPGPVHMTVTTSTEFLLRRPAGSRYSSGDRESRNWSKTSTASKGLSWGFTHVLETLQNWGLPRDEFCTVLFCAWCCLMSFPVFLVLLNRVPQVGVLGVWCLGLVGMLSWERFGLSLGRVVADLPGSDHNRRPLGIASDSRRTDGCAPPGTWGSLGRVSSGNTPLTGRGDGSGVEVLGVLLAETFGSHGRDVLGGESLGLCGQASA